MKNNEKFTVLFRISEFENREHNKYLEGGKPIIRKTVENTNEILEVLNDIAKKNAFIKDETTIKLCFNQHGDKGGRNTIQINKDNAKTILEKVKEIAPKVKNIKISDYSCRGGTAYNFKNIAQDFCDKNNINLQINAAPENRGVTTQNKTGSDGQTRTVFTTIGKEPSSGQGREKTFYNPKDWANNLGGVGDLFQQKEPQFRKDFAEKIRNEIRNTGR